MIEGGHVFANLAQSIHLGGNYALSGALFGDFWSIYGTGLNVLSIPQWGQLGPRCIFAHQVPSLMVL